MLVAKCAAAKHETKMYSPTTKMILASLILSEMNIYKRD